MVTQQFGEIEIQDDEIIFFSQGIIGFEQLNRFYILEQEDSKPFKWLLSPDNDKFNIPLLDPQLVKDNYIDEFPREVARQFLAEEGNVELFGVVNINNSDRSLTINLKGPIVVDKKKHRGKQVILTSDELPVDYPID